MRARPADSLEAPSPRTSSDLALAFSDYAFEGVPSTSPLLFAESVRSRGGRLRDAPLWFLYREGSPREGLERLAKDLDVELVEYPGDPAFDVWPFAAKAAAAARAEERAAGQYALLAWFDRDSLATGDLGDLVLPEGMGLGYRPVNAANIGSPAAEAADGYWSRVYELAGLDPDATGTTLPYLGGGPLRFYIAAGLIVVRPERGVLRRWDQLCRNCAADETMARLAGAGGPRRIFMHQAALAAATVSFIPPEERLELARDFMYPLNFWEADDATRRPEPPDRARSLRYDAVFEDEGWRRLPFSRDFASWLEARLRAEAGPRGEGGPTQTRQ